MAGLASGIELHHVECGSGSPMILLHGGMGDASSWAHQMTSLSRRHRVIAYSRRFSHPNRNARRGRVHSIGDDVEDLRALQEHLGTGPAHLVGTSYGALVALAFALAHVDRVHSLVLAEPPLHRWACRTPSGARLFEAFIERVWQPAALAFAHGLERHAMQLLTDGMWGRPTFESLPKDRVDAALRNAGAMKVLVRSPDPFPELARAAVMLLAMPVLLVQGERSSELHRRVMDELAAGLPHASRVEIASAGHGSPSENPGDFDAAVLEFTGALSWPVGAPT